MEEDDIVDKAEINTNVNFESESTWGVQMAKLYGPKELKKWRPAPVVPREYGKPGDMGMYLNITYYIVVCKTILITYLN